MHSTTNPARRSALRLVLSFAVVAGAGWLAAAAAGRQAAPTAPTPVRGTTVILVRHAEKALDDPKDPGLSPAGAARAQALARLLAHSGATALYTSEFRRTRETLAPLAKELGLESHAHPAADSAGLARTLAALPPGSVAVVCGHSNTVPAIAKALGVELRDLDAEGRIAEGSYDRLFSIGLPGCAGGLPGSVEMRYGD